MSMISQEISFLDLKRIDDLTSNELEVKLKKQLCGQAIARCNSHCIATKQHVTSEL